MPLQNFARYKTSLIFSLSLVPILFQSISIPCFTYYSPPHPVYRPISSAKSINCIYIYFSLIIHLEIIIHKHIIIKSAYVRTCRYCLHASTRKHQMLWGCIQCLHRPWVYWCIGMCCEHICYRDHKLYDGHVYRHACV